MLLKDVVYYKEQLQNELHAILKYWSSETINPETGQFYGEISGVGVPDIYASKGIIMYARIMWTFSAAAQFYNDTQYIKTADIARECIENSFFDKKNGGYYWEISHDEKPVVTKKQVYAQAFVLYAYAEYYKATKQQHALNKALDIFHLLQTHCYDSVYGGYFEAFSENWDKLDDVRLSERDLNLPKGMNTNLHVLEAYTCLLQATQNAEVSHALEKLVSVFTTHIIDKKGHVVIFFTENWTPQTHEISYGHDIETSWLLCEACKTINNKTLIERTRPIVLKMVDIFLCEGYDEQAHAVLYEYNTKTKHLDTDRHWWVQVEAMEGLAHAYTLTQNKEYLTVAFSIWEYVSTYFIDKTNNEWFWRVSQNNIPYLEDPKISMWKCPYHSARALMQIITKLRTIF